MDRVQVLMELLKTDWPLIQAPMAGVSTPQLAAAVSNAGALGSIAIGASSLEAARAMIRKTRSLTRKPFNVNLFCHRPAVPDPERERGWLEHLRPFFDEFGAEPPTALRKIYRNFNDTPAVLELLLSEKPTVVSFHFGLPPTDWIVALRDAGIVTLACVTNRDEAQLAERASVDVLVAQGAEAGGHRGVFAPEKGDLQLGTLPLVRLLAEQTPLPVIAAGGIMDGRGMAAAMAFGAAGVQLGTAFILCPESAANESYRAALMGPRAGHTQITAAISGRPARGITNRMMCDIDAPEAPTPPDYPIAYDAGKALNAAASARGSSAFGAHWAGQGAPLARAMPAGELVERLLAEYRRAVETL